MFKTWAIANIALAAASVLLHRSKLKEVMSAEAAMRVLLREVGSKLSRDIHKGMRLPLSQEGYETSLGNVQMTAFVLRFAEAYGFEVVDANALQGFVMHYNGYCTKRSFTDLLWELGGKEYRQKCKGAWIREVTDESFLQIGRTVTKKEFEAFQFKENMVHRAAAFDAAMHVDVKETPVKKLRHFVKNFVRVLNGKVIDEQRFNTLVDSLATTLAGAHESDDGAGLDALAEALYDDSESDTPAVQLRALESRQVDSIEDSDGEEEESNNATGVGSKAPLSEAGYLSVAGAENNADMATFINRTAANMGLHVSNTLNLNAFAPWFSGKCSNQSFAALQSELRTVQYRTPLCGGGWIQEQVQESASLISIIKKVRQSTTKTFGSAVADRANESEG